MREVFTTFLRLGLTSFGGPIAHLAYFRRAFVDERRWLDPDTYARIVAFCSVLPGPTSSQVGMLVGFVRGGARGAFVAWLCFTAPSAILMTLIAAVLTHTAQGSRSAWFDGLLDGLFAAAAAVVAQAVIALAATLCTDRPTKTIALGAAILALALRPVPALQWLSIAAGAGAGIVWLRGAPLSVEALPIRIPRAASVAAAVVFLALVSIVVLPKTPLVAFAATIVRAGSLVFGGGHVVLPLLQSLVHDGLVGERAFFAGYGAAQAMPGPVNTVAAYLGYANGSPLHGVAGAFAGVLLIFAPSFALIFAIAPVWNRVTRLPAAGNALRGANASVVGLLGAVLYDPVLLSLGGAAARVGIALAAFGAVVVWRVAPWIVVIAAALAGALLRA